MKNKTTVVTVPHIPSHHLLKSTCTTALILAGGAVFAMAQTVDSSSVVPPSETAFSLLLKGGPVMIPLALCSIIALALGIERFMSLKKGTLLPGPLLQPIMGEGSLVGEEYQKIARTGNSVLARLLDAALKEPSKDVESLDRTLEESANREVSRLRRSLRGLRIIAVVAPLLGLLGTVSGMIRAFQTVALSSGSIGRAEMLAQGIYEAMVTTAIGLIIAIPTLVAFFFLTNKVDSLAEEIEDAGNAIVRKLSPQSPKP